MWVFFCDDLRGFGVSFVEAWETPSSLQTTPNFILHHFHAWHGMMVVGEDAGELVFFNFLNFIYMTNFEVS